ncbi:hypothetical protein RGI145_09450 [Roseomonas gilardii]|uniref:Uncharacterized protein n=1 Tax=Roseomonas gilardii TaxID=257708 RepID=A0A1L7AER1_9PROT|nr:hypothetical protein RGI145_09450 [Roseomonas gilardii]
METYAPATSDVLCIAIGIGLLVWCSLAVYTASRSDRLHQEHSMASLQRSMEDSLRTLRLRRAMKRSIPE